MATPFASAEAALIIATNPSLSAARVAQVLESTTRDLGPAGPDAYYGHGLINPTAALLAASPHAADFGRDGNGYWITTSDGRVLSYGHAHFYGDLSGHVLSAPIVASTRTHDGKGYWLVGCRRFRLLVR